MMIEGTSFIHMNARLYDYGSGVFTSTDPLFADMQRAGGLNAYGYVYGNPFRFTDPSGMGGEDALASFTDDQLRELEFGFAPSDLKQQVRIEYNNVQERHLNFSKDNPKATPIPFSENDFEVFVANTRLDIQEQELYFPFSTNSTNNFLSSDFTGQFGGADTYLWRETDGQQLGGQLFDLGGSLQYGGDVNYIKVGMLASHYGLTSALPQMVISHNLGQYYEDPVGGAYNLAQIPPAIFWSLYGAWRY
jgi:RHS repeat-associated protein